MQYILRTLEDFLDRCHFRPTDTYLRIVPGTGIVYGIISSNSRDSWMLEPTGSLPDTEAGRALAQQQADELFKEVQRRYRENNRKEEIIQSGSLSEACTASAVTQGNPCSLPDRM
jgi:hypothetical protein